MSGLRSMFKGAGALLSQSSDQKLLYVWGQNNLQQLGCQVGDDGVIVQPTRVAQLDSVEVYSVSIGLLHTLILTNTGLLGCGSNQHGQLGREDRVSSHLGAVQGLGGEHIVHIAVGDQHSLALTECGQLFSWGDNDTFGQLGRNAPTTHIPGLVEFPGDEPVRIARIAVGKYHNIVLAQDGAIYVWGANHCGCLGLGPTLNKPYIGKPQVLESVRSLHFVLVAAGGEHSFALTKSGALFGWGRNSHGQLGLGSQEDLPFPCCCRALRKARVRYIACGLLHTVVLTEDGGVFTFGNGEHGQLGHNKLQDEHIPIKCMELMGTTITQIACGRFHTIAYAAGSDRVYSFGLSLAGQLGLGSLERRSNPAHITTIGSQGVNTSEPRASVRTVFAGGDGCVVACQTLPNSGACDFRHVTSTQAEINEELISFILSYTDDSAPLSKAADRKICQSFRNASSWNGSFLLSPEEHYGCGSSNFGIDLDRARETLNKLSQCQHSVTKNIIEGVMESSLLPSLNKPIPDVEALRVFLLVPFLPLFHEPSNHATMQAQYSHALINLSKNGLNVIEKWLKLLPRRHFKYYLVIFKKVVKFILCLKPSSSELEVMTRHRSIQTALEVMKLLFKVNGTSHEQLLSPTDFYISEVNDKVDIKMDYINWYQKTIQTQNGTQILSFCNYAFVFDALAKAVLLHTDAHIQMKQAIDQAHRMNLMNLLSMQDPVHPCLVMSVRRDHLIHDTMTSLAKQMSADLKKPLQVQFVGEEAIDEGGLRKEFFLLLLKEVLDPKYGMFTYHPDSRLQWFSPQAEREDTDMFQLIGLLCGLAIYNATIIDLPFPLALYKKILGKPPNLDDLRELDPQLGRSLQILLDYEGTDVEDTFCLTFSMQTEVFGEIITVDFIPRGRDTSVNNENRTEYVESYINYIFNESIKPFFEEFNRGFHRVCGSKVLNFFHPMELQAMVVGNEEYDWKQLEKSCTYQGAFFRNQPTIDMFWSVFHDLPHENKKQFLLFLTGCNRIPIQGMSSLKMTIQPVKTSDDHLPVAHTCFNLLDLPIEYSSREKLRQKLMAAIENTQGFGLV